MVRKPALLIVSPASRAANNGNWRTAERWSRFLRPRYRVDVMTGWTGETPAPQCMIALHARRSAPALAAFSEAYPQRARVLVLTGTDLYRDIAVDAHAARSLDLATHLVVLQDAGEDALDARHRAKCRVIYQSAPARLRSHRRVRHFDVVLVGHMRAEKDPLTPMRALEHLPADSPVRLVHIGDALDDVYASAARALQASTRRYRWLGPRGHGETRRRIADAHALIVSSVIEGGANVIVEAVTSGVPVAASRIPGNIGMLGRDYDGYFTPGDDVGLADLLARMASNLTFREHLAAQCAIRATLFDPAREASAVQRLANDAIAWHPAR